MTTALATIGGLLGNQSRRENSRQPMPSSLAVLGAIKDKKLAKQISREADKERLYALLTQPEVLGFIIAIGGLIASNNIPMSSDEATNAYLQSIASLASVLMGLGYAGVGDLTTLSVALIAGGGSLFGNILGGSTGDLGEWYRYINPIGWLISEVT